MALASYPPTPYAIGIGTLISFLENDVFKNHDDKPDRFIEGLFFDDPRVDADATLTDLLHHPSLQDLTDFGPWLETATQSFDAFIDLMSSLMTVNTRSVADMYRRALVLRYERLSMTEVVVLYKRFCRETKEALSSLSGDETSTTTIATTKKNKHIHRNMDNFEHVFTCIQNKDRVGAIENLHHTMDHSLFALSAAGELQEVIFSAFGENPKEAKREGIRAAQKQGEHHHGTTPTADQTTEAIRPTHTSNIVEEDPELAMLNSLLNKEETLSLEDRHIVARKKLMGRFQPTQNLYQEALKCMIRTTHDDDHDTTVVPFEFIGFYLHEWAVRREEWVAANAWMAAIESHLHPRLDPSIFADYISQKALLLSRQGKWEQAVKLIEGFLERQQKEHGSDDAVWERLCLQLGQLLLDAKQYTAAQAVLLQCRVSAANLSLLAILHLEFYKDIDKARGFAAAALPTVMLQEHVFLQGQCALTLARCTGAMDMFDQSLKCFRSIQDITSLRKTYQCLAIEYDKRQNSSKREEALSAAAALQQTPDTSSPLPDSDELLSYIDQFAASGNEWIQKITLN